MPLHSSVAQHIPRIRELAEEYGVAKLEIFGSAMTDAFDPERSDVDFIVHYPDGYDFGYFLGRFQDFEADISQTLDRPAQLVMTSALNKDSFRQSADKTRFTIYDASESGDRPSGHPEILSVHHR